MATRTRPQTVAPKPETGKRSQKGYRVGFWHGRAKQPDSIVAAVRADYKPGVRGYGYASVAKKWGVPFETARDWCNYVTRGIV